MRITGIVSIGYELNREKELLSPLTAMVVAVCGFLLLALPLNVIANPTLSASQLEQIKGLSDGQKRQLAEQYGISIPGNVPPSRILSETPLEPSQLFPSPEERSASGAPGTKQQSTDPMISLRYGDLKPFGYNLFESEPTTFAPVGGVPAPEQYVIGPGDRLRVFLFGKESAQYDLVVNRDGTLIIPDIDRFNVQGLRFEAVRELIEARVNERKIGVTAVVTLDELRSIQVFVLGDVNQPGSFAVSAFSTIVNALFVAGGVSEQGSLREIQLKRDGQTVATLDLYNLLLRGDARADVRVRQGDVIFVPAVGNQVAVRGEVKRPGIFEFKPTESVADIVKFASGFSGFAFQNEIRIRRTVNGIDRISRSVDQSEIVAITPSSGDIVEILAVNALPTKTVELSGLFSRPGYQEWREGLTLADIVTSPRDLMIPPLETLLVIESRDIQGALKIDLVRGSEVFADPMVAARGMGRNDRITAIPIQSQATTNQTVEELEANGENKETAAFNLKTRLDRKRFFVDLNQRVVASSALTSVAPIVRVSGMVNDPGEYPLSTRATVGDLIIAAGGFSSDADIQSVELVKRTQSAFEIISLSAAEFNKPAMVSAGSELIIRQDQEKTLLPAVEVRGFVKFPGVYRMPRGSTIGQLLQRAGGMLPNADLRAAVFSRVSIKRREAEQLERLRSETAAELASAQVSGLGTDVEAAEGSAQLANLVTDLSKAETVGRLVINLPSILAGQTNQDVILEDGDVLTVPSIRQSVTVIGEVLYPTSHVYQLGSDHERYLEMSGGPSSRADMGRAFVVRADGSVAPLKKFNSRSALLGSVSGGYTMEPGDTLIVPQDLDDLPALDLWTKVTQILYQSAVAVAAVSAL